MALSDHLRELRSRLLRSVTVIVIGMIVALNFYDQIVDLLIAPYYDAREMLQGEVKSEIVVNGLATSLLIQLKISALTSVVLTSPYWLMQIWRFLLPGLHANERRWTRIFAGLASPLFLCGAGLGYYVLPKGIQVLISFTPANVSNLVQIDDYITFLTRMILVFGIAFEIPLFIVMLNMTGVLRAKTLAKFRAWYIIGVFIFAAVATPSTDPFSMLLLGIPVLLLVFIAEAITHVLDRRRGVSGEVALGDDEISSI